MALGHHPSLLLARSAVGTRLRVHGIARVGPLAAAIRPPLTVVHVAFTSSASQWGPAVVPEDAGATLSPAHRESAVVEGSGLSSTAE